MIVWELSSFFGVKWRSSFIHLFFIDQIGLSSNSFDVLDIYFWLKYAALVF